MTGAAAPDGSQHHSLIPVLAVADVDAAVDFHLKAFGAREVIRTPGPLGKTAHGQVRIGDTILFVALRRAGRPAVGAIESDWCAIRSAIYGQSRRASLRRLTSCRGRQVSRRGTETALAWWTLVVLAIYVPVETWVSLPAGLLDPYYLIDAIAMALLLWGAVHSLRARPRPSPELLCIGAAWASASGWRAAFGRLREIEAGAALTYGSVAMWTVGIATALGLLVFGALLVLVALNQRLEPVA